MRVQWWKQCNRCKIIHRSLTGCDDPRVLANTRTTTYHRAPADWTTQGRPQLEAKGDGRAISRDLFGATVAVHVVVSKLKVSGATDKNT